MNIMSTDRALSFKAPSLLIKRFCQEYKVREAEAEERFEETKKFLVLCATYKQETFSPSKKIDEMWHHFIIFSKSYFSFCNQLGTYLHHEPCDTLNYARYERTRNKMKSYYGRLNLAYWDKKHVSAGHCDCSD